MSDVSSTLESLDVINLVIRLLEVIAWPLVFVILVLVFILIFREDVRGLLRRVTNISKSGLAMEPPLNPVQPDMSVEKAAPDVVVNTDHLKEYLHSVNLQREFLSNELRGVEGEQLNNYLVEHLAFARALWVFESIFNFIYAGQIVFLKMLNDRQGTGISKADLPGLWALHQKKHAPLIDSWDGNVYIGYLYGCGLIMDHGDAVKITRTGVEFLMWMTRNGRSESMRTL